MMMMMMMMNIIIIIRNPKSYPHPRLQDFPRWKKT